MTDAPLGTDQQDLAPCPFCGASANGPHHHEWDRAPGGYWWIECSSEDCSCGMEGQNSDGSLLDKQAIVERWNRRVP